MSLERITHTIEGFVFGFVASLFVFNYMIDTKMHSLPPPVIYHAYPALRISPSTSSEYRCNLESLAPPGAVATVTIQQNAHDGKGWVTAK